MLNGTFITSSIELKRLDEMITPKDKLKVFIDLSKVATDTLELYSENSITSSAELDSLLTHIIINGCPKQLQSTLKYDAN